MEATNEKVVKSCEKYECKLCDFTCRYESDYNRHVLTRKHKIRTNTNKKVVNSTEKYECKLCDFTCRYISDYNRHLLSQKHKQCDKKVVNSTEKYECNLCDFTCRYISDYNRHLLSLKHNQLCENIEIFAEKYECKLCDFKCIEKFRYERHLKTSKHILRANEDKSDVQNYKCQCGRSYKHASSLWNHQLKCTSSIMIPHEDEDNESADYEKIIETMVNENKQLQTMIKTLIPTVGNTTHNTTNNNTTNNTNNQFNLNFFLNEQCKDAIPLIDFVKSLQYDFDQLEYTGKHGFVEGASKIIMDAMNQLDITKRPIHCTDVKRETFYVKDDESWKKEDDRNRSIKTAIHNIRNRNLACVPEWIRAHPNCKKIDDPNNDLFIEIIGQYMDASETEFNKVIKVIAKSLTIPKSNYGRKFCIA
jgi:hypothetical protein